MESMIYAASHDLRSPLVNIQGFSQRLVKASAELDGRLGMPDVPEAIRRDLTALVQEKIPVALGYIRSSSQKMDQLINALLRLSRAGRAQLMIHSVDMNSLLADILRNHAIQIQEARADIDVAPLLPCLGDGAQLNQVFSNLIDNALKYYDPARRLVISIDSVAQNDRVCYRVRDTGIGIPEEYQARVWQLFHRLDPAGKVSGEGLGLTLVKRIIERMRGRVALSSVPGQGSCFTIEMPAETTTVVVAASN
jgi:signal transduction histidine kinase